MNLNSPVFRKIIIPWHDSDIACFIMIGLMLAVFIFGIFGISSASETQEYQLYIWIPAILMFMSLFVIVSTLVRFFMRNNLIKKQNKHKH